MSQRTGTSDQYCFGIEATNEPSDPHKDQHPRMEDAEKRGFWHFTLYEILTVLCAAAIPIAVGIYTGVQLEQSQRQADATRQFDLKQAEELRQQTLYDQFLDNIYNLDKDGYLKEKEIPWAFANAYFRAAHRQWDTLRKADVLQFLVERRLIRTNTVTGNHLFKAVASIIRLNELNFDHVYLTSQTNSLNQLDLQSISFDQVSMVDARFSFVNLDGASFIRARLNQAKFDDSSLAYATFDTTLLHQTDFGNSNLTGTRFLNVDLSTAKLTPDQLKQAICVNTTLSNGTICSGAAITTTGEIYEPSLTRDIKGLIFFRKGFSIMIMTTTEQTHFSTNSS